MKQRTIKPGSFYKKGSAEIGYLLVNVFFNKAIGLLYIPFVQDKLGREAFIQYDFYLTLATLGTSLFILGMDSGIISYLEDNLQENKSNLFTKSLFFGSANILLISIASFFIYLLLQALIKADIFDLLYPALVASIILNTIIIAFQNYIYSLLRWMGKSDLASISNILIPVSGIIPGALYFFLSGTPTLLIFLFINFIGSAIGLVTVLFYFRYKLLLTGGIAYTLAEHKAIFKFSLPLGINSILFNLVRYADRFIIALVLGASGIRSNLYADYLVLQRIAQFLASVLQLIGAAFLPMLFEQSRTASGKMKVSSFFKIYLLAHLPYLLVSVVAFFVIKNNFISDHTLFIYFPLSVIGFFALADTTITGIGFFRGKKSKEILILSLAYLVLNTAAEFYVGYWFGVKEIFITNCFFAILYAIVYSYRAEKHYSIGFNIRLFAIIYCVLFALSTSLIFFFGI